MSTDKAEVVEQLARAYSVIADNFHRDRPCRERRHLPKRKLPCGAGKMSPVDWHLNGFIPKK